MLRRGVSVPGEPAGEMMFPLVCDLAADGIPVTVQCRVLELYGARLAAAVAPVVALVAASCGAGAISDATCAEPP